MANSEPNTEATVKIIDYFLKRKEYAVNEVPIFTSDLMTEGVEITTLENILQDLIKEECFQFSNQQTEAHLYLMASTLFETEEQAKKNMVTLDKSEINSLKLHEYKQKVLGKSQRSIIKALALERIARDMGASDTATGLIDLLNECEVPKHLIIYPNTKWRMINDIFRVLATSTEPSDHALLFAIMEEHCHPIRYNGDTRAAQEKRDWISSLIRFNGYCFVADRIVSINDEKQGEIARQAIEALEKRLKDQKSNEEFSKIFQAFFANPNNKSSTPNAPTQKQTQEQHNPVTVNINNVQSNVNEVPKSQAAPPKRHADGMYKFKELEIDMKGRVLRNIVTDQQKDLSGFQYQFLNALIVASGTLVEHDAMAKAVRDGTVAKLTPKEVADRKSKFVKMLKEELGISESTAEALIQGKDGYRINRKIYEEVTTIF
jgi:hypothetical protein